MEDDSANDTVTSKLIDDTDQSKDKPFSFKYTLYSRRWLILLVFSLTSMMNEEVWISLSTITSLVEKYYSVDPVAVNWLSLIYLLFMSILLAPSSYFLHRFGLRWTMSVGALLNAVGSSIRVCGSSRNGFVYVFIGSCFTALGQCFLFFLPPHIAAVWFGDKERDVASSIGMLVSLSGAAVGFLTSAFFVSSQAENESHLGRGLHNLLLFEALTSTSLFIICAVIVKGSPPSPPSRSQDIRLKAREAKHGTKTKRKNRRYNTLDSTEQTEDEMTSQENEKGQHPNESVEAPTFEESMKTLFKNRHFHLLCQAYAIYFALLVTYATVLNQIGISSFPGQEQKIGYMGFTLGVSGLVSMFISGCVLTKTKQYRVYSMAVFSLCCFTAILLNITFSYAANLNLTFVFIAMYGFFSYPYVSVGLEYVAEITYPVPENVSASVCLIFASAYGIILTQVLGSELKDGHNIAGYVISVSYAVGFVLTCLVRAPLKRTSVDVMEGNNQ